MSYFEEGSTLPPPFNILPSVKWLTRCFKKKKARELKRGSTMVCLAYLFYKYNIIHIMKKHAHVNISIRTYIIKAPQRRS